MKLNIEILKNVITTKITLIKKNCYVFTKIEFIIMIKKNLIRDLDI